MLLLRNVRTSVSFIGNWLIYRVLLTPLVKRSKTQGALEANSILATFGMSFILIGIMVSIEGGFFAYKYLSEPIVILGSTTSLNRLVAFCVALAIGAALLMIGGELFGNGAKALLPPAGSKLPTRNSTTPRDDATPSEIS